MQENGPEPARMTQSAPYPSELADLVEHTTYRAGWEVWLEDDDRGQDCSGLTVVILTDTVNSYPPHHSMRVRHLFGVPAAAYDRQAWCRWLFEQFLLVERHECMEFFTVGGVKPFAPVHAPGHDPYTVTQLTTDEARRTSWRGDVSAEVAHYADHHDGLAGLRNTDPIGYGLGLGNRY